MSYDNIIVTHHQGGFTSPLFDIAHVVRSSNSPSLTGYTRNGGTEARDRARRSVVQRHEESTTAKTVVPTAPEERVRCNTIIKP